MTGEEYIKRCKEVHGEKYDYSRVVYVSLRYKIVIICPVHGPFTQIAANHLYGKKGCFACAKERRNMTPKRFVSKAKQIWGDRWDYTKTVYTQAHVPVTITCPLHGDFKQDPYNHLHGHIGCRKCDVRQSPNYQFARFLERAGQVHKGKYDYSRAEYVDYKTPITIICPEHGEFMVTPTRHLFNEIGCPKCRPPIIRRYGPYIPGKLTVEEFELLKEVVREYVQEKQPA